MTLFIKALGATIIGIFYKTIANILLLRQKHILQEKLLALFCLVFCAFCTACTNIGNATNNTTESTTNNTTENRKTNEKFVLRFLKCV